MSGGSIKGDVNSGVDVKTVSSMLRHINVRTALASYSCTVDANKQYLELLLLTGLVQWRNEKRNGN